MKMTETRAELQKKAAVRSVRSEFLDAYGFGRDHGRCTALAEVFQLPFRIKRLVRKEHVKAHSTVNLSALVELRHS